MSKRNSIRGTEALHVDDCGVIPVSQDTAYSRIRDGEYDARCMDAKVYRDPRYKRWTCRLRFLTVPDGIELFGFLNLGNGETVQVKRGSEYRHAWIIANGEAPRKRQAMSASVFTNKIFRVLVTETTLRHDHSNHHEAEIYSKVKKILSKQWG